MVACSRVYSFPFLHSIPLYWTYQNLFIRSTVAGHLSVSQLVAIMNKFTINILVHVFWWMYTLILVGFISKSGIAGVKAM